MTIPLSNFLHFTPADRVYGPLFLILSHVDLTDLLSQLLTMTVSLFLILSHVDLTDLLSQLLTMTVSLFLILSRVYAFHIHAIKNRCVYLNLNTQGIIF